MPDSAAVDVQAPMFVVDLAWLLLVALGTGRCQPRALELCQLQDHPPGHVRPQAQEVVGGHRRIAAEDRVAEEVGAARVEPEPVLRQQARQVD